MPKIAFIGLGNMGKPMACTLLDAGWPVAVYNRTANKADGLEGKLRVAQSPADAVAGAEVVITMLADDDAVDAVVHGPHGFLSVMPENAIHICTSTISVAASRRLATEHAAARRAYVAAPVFGRPEAAAAAKLWVVAGGPTPTVVACQPVFECFAQGAFHVGEAAETANLVKVAGNFAIASVLETLGETMALVRKAGIPPGRFLEIINSALFQSPLYANYGTLIADELYEPAGFKMRLGLKDVRLAQAAAEESNVPMPLAGVIHDHLLSGVARGLGDRDWSALAAIIAANAGLGEV